MNQKQRILVVGSPGAGKSTFSKELAKITGLPLYHLDKLYWKENWEKPSHDEWEKILDEVIELDSWIIDGNYASTMEKRIARATIVYFLDYSRYLCVKSVLKRIKIYNNTQRDDITNGCIEKYDREFLQWVWDFPIKYRPVLLEILSNYPNIKVIYFKNRDEASNYLVSIRREYED